MDGNGDNYQSSVHYSVDESGDNFHNNVDDNVTMKERTVPASIL